jgi:hypothetical protein
MSDRTGIDLGRRISQLDAASMISTMSAPTGATWRGCGQRTALSLCAVAFCAVLFLPGGMASGQDRGSVNPAPLPPACPSPDDPKTPARELFGRKTAPAPLQTRTIGSYAKGCLAGAVALPINGETGK